MGIKAFIFGTIASFMFERPAQKQSPEELAQKLQASGEEIAQRLQSVPETPDNRERLRHIIGIERWGRERMQTVTAGEQPVMDEHDPYQPEASLDWAELRQAFQETREETVELARTLPPSEAKIPHNQFGEMSAKGWLYCLEGHARMESKGFKEG